MRRKLYWLCFLAVLLVLAPMALAQDGMDVVPPRVIDTTPLEGEELALNSPITFVFDRPMDTEATENDFSVSPELAGEGTFTWQDDHTLLYTPPAEGYARDTEYTFSLQATSEEGTAMPDAFTLTLRSLGYLVVSETSPVDGTKDLGTNTTISIFFNRPVVPLVSLEDLEDLPTPITISPEVAGTGEWINTSIYSYKPTSLAGGVTYTVTVDPELVAVDGATLQEPYSFSFTTAHPEIRNLFLTPDQDVIPRRMSFEVEFTQPMDQATQEGIRVTDNLGNSVPLTYTWSRNGRNVTVAPVDLLEMDSFYEIVVDSAVVKGIGGASIQNTVTRQFITVPYPAITKTFPADGDVADPYGDFRIYFNAPIDPDSLVGKITIDPEPENIRYDSYYYEYDKQYSISFSRLPSTEYTVTIAPGISDPYSNTIDTETVVRFTTAAYEPSLNLQVPGWIGTYNAYNPLTQVFVTHRNLERIDLAVFNISLPELARLTGPESYKLYDEYRPQDVIRSWTLPVTTPLNQWRYELLTLSAEGTSGVGGLTCVGAPESRLWLGGQTVVSDDDPSPLRMRDQPTISSNILDEYAPGATLQIVGGPLCADKYWWWQVYDEEKDQQGWMAEGSTNLYFLDPVGTAPTNNPSATPSALPPGAYLLEVSSPEVFTYNNRPYRHLLIVQNKNITMKFSTTQALAWVTDMETGLPVEGATVRFYNGKFEETGFAVTDADGLASSSIPRLDNLYRYTYAVIQEGEDFGFVMSDFTNGIDPWYFSLSTNYYPDNDSIYLYTDRPIYRPDQPVYYRGVVRAQDDVTYTIMPDVREVLAQVYNSEGSIVQEQMLEVTPHGTFSGTFDLDAGAALGYYRVSISLPTNVQEDPGVRYEEEASIGFSVAEYQAPEFQLTLTPALTEVAQGDKVRVEVDSRYFFGAPVSNGKITYNVVTNDYYFNYQGEGYWSFTEFNYDSGPDDYYGPTQELVANGEGTTDAQGKFVVEIPADLGEKTLSQILTIEAVVTDESDQIVAGRTEVIVHQGRVYVGLAPEEYVGTEGEETAFKVLSVDWESEPVEGQVVDYRIVRREWSSVQEKDTDGRTVWKWTVEEIEVDSGSVTTDAEGLGRVVYTPPQAGTYKMYASTTDVDGNVVNSSAFMWVSGTTYVPWRQSNSNTIDLITDADSYTVGDTAEILIASPFQGQTQALITVERGKIISTEVVTMESNSYVYRLPITEDYAPNVFVSVVLVKGMDDTTPYTQFRVGMTQLAVDTERLNLNVEVTPDLAEGETAGPGDEVTLNIKTTDWEGNPVSAEVGIGVTDLAVLTIAPANSGTLMGHFYGQQGLSVRTASPLSISVDQMTQEIIDTIKGGGGGGGELGIFEVRQEFVDTPLWEPTVVTDENGEAQVTITLPDNLTTWRIDARGITNGADRPMLVGQSLGDFISTKPLLVRPVTPRFFVVGDKPTIGTVINNNTDEEQVVDVFMEGSGFLVAEDSPIHQSVTIPAGGRARVDWNIEILDVGFVDVTFAASNADGSLQDASKPPVGQGDERTLPVYRYSVKETVGTAGLIEPDEGGSITEYVSLPARILDASQGDLKIKIDRSLAGPTLDGLDYLENYPYQCVEQTISKFLPNVMTIRALNSLNQSNPELELKLQVAVNYGVQRLYNEQNVDGGWGWVAFQESSPLTTAYALIGLVEAQKSGFTIDQKVIDDARTFLRQWLLGTGGDVRVTQDDWRLNRRAFVLYAMTRAGEPNASMNSALYNVREKLNLDAKAFLAMSMMMVDPADERIAAIMSDFNNAVVVSATGAYWDDREDRYNWTTSTRTTALVLSTMLQEGNQANQLLSNVVRWLMVARTADAWETTQETAWAVMALTDWMVATGELDANYEFNVRLNDKVLEFEDNTANAENVKTSEELHVAVADLLVDTGNRLVISKTAGEGNLYYTAHLNAFLKVPEVKAQSKGIILNRKYYLKGDENKIPITQAMVGQEVVVEISIIAPRQLHYVVIEDPIPAGSAAVDPNLLTTSQLTDDPRLERDDPWGRGWGWWWFTRREFRDEKVVMYAEYLPPGSYTYTYIIRMGLAGEYNVIPTTGQEFYFPEVYGRGDGMLFTILPEAEVPVTEMETDTESESDTESETETESEDTEATPEAES